MTNCNNVTLHSENGDVILQKEYKINTLKELCSRNAELFAKDITESGQRLFISFSTMIEIVDQMWPKILCIHLRVHEFDFDEDTPGNGYRSYLIVIEKAIELCISVNERVLHKKDSVLFRKGYFHTKDVESCSHLLTSLDVCLTHLQTLLSWCDKGNLFTKEDHRPDELFLKCGEISQHCFYGRNLGFQYCDSIKNVLQFIGLSMALFSEVYYNEGSLITKATNSVLNTTKYLRDPEQRAKRIVNISQNAEVDFCKAFWFLAESDFMNQLPSIASPSVAISRIIHIPPEPLRFSREDGTELAVPVPSSHIGRKSIQVRLISYKMREGMIGSKSKKVVEPPSKGLIIHCHGGGFVAQSSKSHEGYLRDWAKYLDVPILCIDYSLAPEAPFPRAFEEVFYVYCWARKNHLLLGSTGEQMVGAGDSAGANLLLTVTLNCIQNDIPTLKGLFLAYAPTAIHFMPSPARLLCIMDPLLPFGFLMRCLKAYASSETKKETRVPNSHNTSDTESFEEISESDLVELQAHKSPVSETSDTVTYGSLTDNDATVVDLNVSDVEKSQQIVSEMVEQYVLEPDKERTTSTEKAESTSFSNDNSIHKKVFSFVSNLRSHFINYVGDRTLSAAEKFLDTDINTQSSMIDKFTFSVPKDPLLSPIFASDEDLKKFPPTRFLTVQMDPCLDDCVMFARRLKDLGKNVGIEILPGLPHGFLNFSLFSKEAFEGSKRCAERIQELLNLEQ